MKIFTTLVLLALSSIQAVVAESSTLRAANRYKKNNINNDRKQIRTRDQVEEEEEGWVNMLDPASIEQARRRLFLNINSLMSLDLDSIVESMLESTVPSVLADYDPFTIGHTETYQWTDVDITTAGCALVFGLVGTADTLLNAQAKFTISSISGIKDISIDDVSVSDTYFNTKSGAIKATFTVEASFEELEADTNARVLGSACDGQGTVDYDLDGTVTAEDSELDMQVTLQGTIDSNSMSVTVTEATVNSFEFTVGSLETEGFDEIESYVPLATEYSSLDDLIETIINDDVDPALESTVNAALQNELPLTVGVSLF